MSVKKGGEKRDDERTQQRADEDALQKSTDHCPVDEDEQKDDQKKHHGHQPHQKGSGTVEHPTQRDTAAGCCFRGCGAGAVLSSLAVKWRPPVDGAAASGGAGEGSG